MFKMGCSMAKKILAIDGKERAGSQTDGASTSSSKRANKDKQQLEPPGSVMKSKTSGDELGDFSKLEQDPRIPLNVRQIFKITKSWKAIARTMSKTGTAMFLNLFEQNQDLFYLFDRFQHLKGKELHDSMELREHASTVMSTLDQSINSLSDYDNFVAYLHSIGKLHRKVPGFKREHFWKIEQPFLKAVKQTLDERCNETIEEIYKIAIKLIIETIADGYGDDDPTSGAQQAGGNAGDGAARNAKRDTSDGQSSAPGGQQQQQQQQRAPSANGGGNNGSAAPAASGAPRQRSSGDPNQESPAYKATAVRAPPPPPPIESERRAGGSTIEVGACGARKRGNCCRHAPGQAEEEEEEASDADQRLKGTLLVLRELLLLLTQNKKSGGGASASSSTQATLQPTTAQETPTSKEPANGRRESDLERATQVAQTAPRCINGGTNRNNNQDDERNEFVAGGAISGLAKGGRLIACALEGPNWAKLNRNNKLLGGKQSSQPPSLPFGSKTLPLQSAARCEQNVLRRPLCISEFVNKNNNINRSTQSGLKEERKELELRAPTVFSTMIPRLQVKHAYDNRRNRFSPQTATTRRQRHAPSFTLGAKRQAPSRPTYSESCTGTGGGAVGAQHERLEERVCDSAAAALNSTLGGAQQTRPPSKRAKPLDTLSQTELAEFDERRLRRAAKGSKPTEPSRGRRVLSASKAVRTLLKQAAPSLSWQLATEACARQTNDSAAQNGGKQPPKAAAAEGLRAAEACERSRPKEPLGPKRELAARNERTLHNVLLTTNLGDLSELIKMLMLTVASHTHKGKTITSDTNSKDTSASKSKKNIIKYSGAH